MNFFSELRRSSPSKIEQFSRTSTATYFKVSKITATYLAVPGGPPEPWPLKVKTRISVAVAPGGLRGATRRIAIPGFSFRPGQIRRSSLVVPVLRKIALPLPKWLLRRKSSYFECEPAAPKLLRRGYCHVFGPVGELHTSGFSFRSGYCDGDPWICSAPKC